MTYYIGLMTGTSLDGVDSALIKKTGDKYHFIDHYELPMPATLRQQLLALYQSGSNELERAAHAAHHHAQLSAESIAHLLKHNQLQADAITAVGSHGQTLRHLPDAPIPYTIQLQNPALLCELCAIDVIADFRRRDIAAGGQGAPLAPLFQRELLHIDTGCLVNIGGIANISLFSANSCSGFDSGPGNGLMDSWIEQQRGLAFDEQGSWAREGVVIEPLLKQLLQEPFFHKKPPKSSGRDSFDLVWLKSHLQAEYQAQDVQRTLLELSAQTITQSINQSLQRQKIKQAPVILCGGGAKNTFLVERIEQLLADGYKLAPCPIPTQALEAAGFAWLAAQYIEKQSHNLKDITGARGARPLGAWYRYR